jgi:hypothetical protein
LAIALQELVGLLLAPMPDSSLLKTLRVSDDIKITIFFY